MAEKRTDLALEAKELWQESAEETTRLHGVKARTFRAEGWPITRVSILNEAGEKALGKPQGNYLTIDLSALAARKPDSFPRAVRAVGRELRELLPDKGPVLVIGLGNRAMTPDAVGPLALESVLVTRHLVEALPEHFGSFRPVAALRPGVLASTGIESAETVRALTEKIRPVAVIAIDALAARKAERLCTTIQLSDSGIAPGSGVGNHRSALTKASLGVPVIAVGVPTVVDAGTLAADLLERSGGKPQELSREGLMVTPQDIDAKVRELSKVVGFSINWALQGLELEEMEELLS